MKSTDSPQLTSLPILYLCHGGHHKLTLFAKPDSPWINQRISLEETPDQPLLPMTVSPKVGEPQVLEEKGGSWTLMCPAEGVDTELELMFHSEFTAQPYKASISLGDHRLKFGEINTPTDPIILDEETAVLAVKVTSFYTNKAMENVEVEWFVEGETFKKQTQIDGWCEHIFVPKIVGKPDIQVKVWSVYENDYVKHQFDIEVLATSPWASDLEFLWNDRQFSIGDGFTAYPGRYRLRVNPKNQNLIGSLISAETNVGWLNTAQPPLKPGRELTSTGLEWGIHVQAGKFEKGILEWSCSKFSKKRTMPIQVFTFELYGGGYFTLDETFIPAGGMVKIRRGEIHSLKFTPHAPHPNNPIIGQKLILEPSSNNHGLIFSPEFGQPMNITEKELEWSIDARNASYISMLTIRAFCPQANTSMVFNLRT